MSPTGPIESVHELASRHLMPAMSRVRGATEEPVVFDRAEGLRLWDAAGNLFYDGMSGMMNVNLGYGRADIVDAMSDAARRLNFAITFFGYVHAPQARLAAALAAETPGPLNRFFFTTGGSDAIDTAIKLARLYHAERGLPSKTVVLGRRQSYHGTTFAATSLTGAEIYSDHVRPGLGDVHHIGQPTFDGSTPPGGSAAALEKAVRELGPERIAAFIAEPISLPTGARQPPPDYWDRVRQLCDENEILLVSDEVITGFGRTGRMFAIQHWDVEPDLMVMAKGITGGYAPLGAVAVTDRIFDEIAAADAYLAHGFTCGGHPVSCAAALRNLEAIRDEGLVERADEVGAELAAAISSAGAERDLDLGVRRLGALLAVDTGLGEDDLSPLPDAQSIGTRLNAGLRAAGLIARVYGASVVLGPAYCATSGDIDAISDRFVGAVAQVGEES